MGVRDRIAKALMESFHLPITHGEAGYPYKNVVTTEVLKNPTPRDVRGYLKNASPDVMNETNVPTVRTVRDEAGNLYIWDAGAATHVDFQHSAKNAHGIEIDPTTEDKWTRVGSREAGVINQPLVSKLPVAVGAAPVGVMGEMYDPSQYGIEP